MDRKVEILREQRTHNFTQWGPREEEPLLTRGGAGPGTHAEQPSAKQGLPSRGSAGLQDSHPPGGPVTTSFVTSSAKSLQSLHYFHLNLSSDGKSSNLKGVFYF